MALMVEGDDRYDYSVAWIDLIAGRRSRWVARSWTAGGSPPGRGGRCRGRHRALYVYAPTSCRRRRTSFPRACSTGPPCRRSTSSGTARRRRSDGTTLLTHRAVLPPAGHDRRTGTGSTAGGGSCSGSSWCPTAPRTWSAPRSNGSSVRGSPSFLAVLKRIGPGNAGPAVVPDQGLDPGPRHRPSWPASTGCSTSSTRWWSTPAGGSTWPRTAGCARSCCPEMYPRLDEWREVREKLDPQGRFRSDLGRRLHLV